MGRSNGFKTFLWSAAGTITATLLFGGAVNAFRGDKEKEKETPKVEQTIEYDEVSVLHVHYDETDGSPIYDSAIGRFRWYFKGVDPIRESETLAEFTSEHQSFKLYNGLDNNLNFIRFGLTSKGLVIVKPTGSYCLDEATTKQVFPYEMHDGYVEFEISEGQVIDFSGTSLEAFINEEVVSSELGFSLFGTVNAEGEDPDFFRLVEKG